MALKELKGYPMHYKVTPRGHMWLVVSEASVLSILSSSIVAPYGATQKAVPSGVNLCNHQDDSLLPGRLGSHALLPRSHPWWAIWGSMIHHTAGGHVFWKGHELVTSLSLPAWMSAPFFFSCAPSLQSSPFQDCWIVELIGVHSVRPGCRCIFWIEVSSVVPRFHSDLPLRAPSSASVRLPSEVVMGHHHDSSLSVQWHDGHGTLSTVGQLAWSSVCRLFFLALLSLWSLDPACSHGTHSKWQPQGAFIPPAEFNHFSLSSFCLSAELFRV